MIERCYECDRREIRYELHRLWRRFKRFVYTPPKPRPQGQAFTHVIADEVHRMEPSKAAAFTKVMVSTAALGLRPVMRWAEDDLMPRLFQGLEDRNQWEAFLRDSGYYRQPSDKTFAVGDIVRIQTTGGLLHVVDPNSPDLIHFNWSFPWAPSV